MSTGPSLVEPALNRSTVRAPWAGFGWEQHLCDSLAAVPIELREGLPLAKIKNFAAATIQHHVAGVQCPMTSKMRVTECQRLSDLPCQLHCLPHTGVHRAKALSQSLPRSSSMAGNAAPLVSASMMVTRWGWVCTSASPSFLLQSRQTLAVRAHPHAASSSILMATRLPRTGMYCLTDFSSRPAPSSRTT